MYAMGSGLAMSSLTNGRFSPHHTLTYTVNTFFGPDIGSFSEWLSSTIGFGHTFASALADAIHHPFYYILILGLPLYFLYSWVSRVLIQKGVLDSVSGVSYWVSELQSFFLSLFGCWESVGKGRKLSFEFWAFLCSLIESHNSTRVSKILCFFVYKSVAKSLVLGENVMIWVVLLFI